MNSGSQLIFLTGSMFTGIIEDLGVIRKIDASRCVVETKLDGIKIGDSISVNGVCLTVSALSSPRLVGKYLLTFDISEETFRRTNFISLKIGDEVNLERSVKSDGRFGGHFVSGHVDITGRIDSLKKSEKSVLIRIKSPLEYIVEKGSVAVDGISLTVASIDESSSTFEVSVIPHTVENTNLKYVRVGKTVNIEFDAIAKYIKKFAPERESKKITREFLKNAGFI